MNKKTYRINRVDLHHDGKNYPEGSTIELTDEDAQKNERWLTLEKEMPDSPVLPLFHQEPEKVSVENSNSAEPPLDEAEGKSASSDKSQSDVVSDNVKSKGRK